MAKAAIVGVAGTRLSADERTILASATPAGVILFRRNCHDPEQIRALVAEIREVTRVDNLPLLVDQEGGRVARLTGPQFEFVPPMGAIGRVARLDRERARAATAAAATLIASDLRACGLTIGCAPVLDVATDGMTDAIGDRAFASDPELVAELGRVFVDRMLACGVGPVIKHMPGHGRASVDSHIALPVVSADLETLRGTDLVPFQALADAPFGMTAHVLYPAIDPDHPATHSRTVIERIIRGEIGFKNLLMSDDLMMKALSGTPVDRAIACLDAGCDVALFCGCDAGDLHQVLHGVRVMDEARLAQLMAPRACGSFDLAERDLAREDIEAVGLA